jgi:hypothetical protein
MARDGGSHDEMVERVAAGPDVAVQAGIIFVEVGRAGLDAAEHLPRPNSNGRALRPRFRLQPAGSMQWTG